MKFTYCNLSIKVSKDYKIKLHKHISLLKALHLSLLKGMESDKDLVSGLMSFYDFVDRMFRCRGPDYSVLYLKECRQLFLCHLSHFTYVPKGNVRVARAKDLLPMNLGGSLCSLIRTGDTDVLRNVLTALMVTRFLPLRGVPADYSTISDGHDVPLTGGIMKFTKSFIKRKRLNVPKGTFTTYLSTSMGPNGPAMVSSYEDLNCMSSQLKSSLKILTHDSISRSSYLRDDVATWPSLLSDKRKAKVAGVTRKITAIPDKEGKTRLIAIFDY
jgi:hypothetical protein